MCTDTIADLICFTTDLLLLLLVVSCLVPGLQEEMYARFEEILTCMKEGKAIPAAKPIAPAAAAPASTAAKVTQGSVCLIVWLGIPPAARAEHAQ